MSYRKKHYPPKPEKPIQQTTLVDMEYANPGVERTIFSGRLDYSTSNNSLRYARVLLEKYNGTRRTNKQLPYRFKG